MLISYSHQDRNAAIRVDACRDSAVRYSLLDCGKPCTGILVASKQVMAVQSGRMSARCGEPATKSLLRLGEAESGLTTYLRRPAVRSWRLPTSCNVLRHSTWRLTFVSLAAEDGRTLLARARRSYRLLGLSCLGNLGSAKTRNGRDMPSTKRSSHRKLRNFRAGI